jgi:hypothetical protein
VPTEPESLKEQKHGSHSSEIYRHTDLGVRLRVSTGASSTAKFTEDRFAGSPPKILGAQRNETLV